MAVIEAEAASEFEFDKLANPKEKIKRVCFVCTGNTCRSPMAAAYVNGRLSDKGIYAISAGLSPAVGMPISENAVSALEAQGIESAEDNMYKLHTARLITEEDIKNSDEVIGITARHAMALIAAYPQYAGKINAMPRDIPDPYGGSREEYSECLCEIIKGISEML